MSGIAISFCDFDEKAYLKEIQKLIQTEIPVVPEHPYPMQIFEHIPPNVQSRFSRAEREAGAYKKAALQAVREIQNAPRSKNGAWKKGQSQERPIHTNRKPKKARSSGWRGKKD